MSWTSIAVLYLLIVHAITIIDRLLGYGVDNRFTALWREIDSMKKEISRSTDVRFRRRR